MTCHYESHHKRVRELVREKMRERVRKGPTIATEHNRSIHSKIIHFVALCLSVCVLCNSYSVFFLSGFCFMSIFDYMFVLLLNWTTVIIDNDVAQCVMLPSTRIKIFLRSFVCSFVDAAFHSIPFRSVLFAYDVMSKMSAYYLLFFEFFFCSKRTNFCILLCAWISSHPIHRAYAYAHGFHGNISVYH